MKSIHRVIVLSIVSCIALIPFTGCGVNKKKQNDAESRIQALQAKGVPDSLLTEAKVLLSQSKTSKKIGDGVTAKRQYDEAIALLEKAETAGNATTTSLKPFVDSMQKAITLRKKSLTGPQLKVADSLYGVIESFAIKNLWPEAKNACIALDTALTVLQKDEALAKEVRSKIVGTWTSTQKYKDKGVDALEKKTFKFEADGKLEMSEEMKGQTAPTRREDWKFISSGTYDLKGDTALLAVKREKCEKQIYWYLKGKNWDKAEKKPYDSLYTDGRKDRFVTYTYLKENFKK
jgi:hypothetical protein